MLDPRQIAPEIPHPLKRVEYERLVASGAFEDERVELLDGVIVQMRPHGPAHDAIIDRFTDVLVPALGDRAKVRVQCSFAAGDGSEPEPDIAVVPRRDYDDAHPDQAFLIVEVAESSLKKDRDIKARLYAASGVREYWVVSVMDKTIDVFTSPGEAGYASCSTYAKGQSIQLASFADVVVRIDDIIR